MVMVDINNLKHVNDEYGHKNGDMYIKGCCHMISDVFRYSPVYRIGGDEFIVILFGSDYENRIKLCKKLKDEFRATYEQQSIPSWLRYSAAVGMADKAAEYRITLAFEYHRKTLTETAESAVRLIKTVDRENVKLYWQNSAAFTYEENLQNLTAVTPYLAGVFHLGNGRGGQGPQLIEGIREEIEGFYQPFLKTDYKVMMEFVKGGLEESFYSDINVLRECFSLGEATN